MIPKVLVAASVRPLMLSIFHHGESCGYAIIKHIRDLSDGALEAEKLHWLTDHAMLIKLWDSSPQLARA